ncbi:MAG: tetratricopeptide repeat protein [Candidatus Competibacteraceae bacterium]|nr:tetratricopeptide repeat protein [Candidatus Competibacteraceae bacterium]MBK7982323.1 tetratricopeptide repeat protein [Candidatus Competibacteraceae bacterium]MBK8899127.1 tetratricopeptide repeat protein [Candidatus Competibacteraceae bacterium]MBK8963167.1 tetratricopeptide repeat protein [Candidatus Competibacteraceae bacterium]
MNRFLKLLSLGGLLLLSGCATVVDAQAPEQPADAQAPEQPTPEFEIRPPLQPSPRAELTYQILAAELAGKRDQLAVALANYRQAATSTQDPQIAERATMLALLMKDSAASLELAKRWQTLAPDNDQARQALALALLRNGQVDEATEYLETVRRLASAKDKQQGYATLASLLSQADDKPAALRVMKHFRDRNPGSAFAQYYFALLAAASGDRDQALASLDRALARDPKLASAHQLRTHILLDRGANDAALAGLTKAVGNLPRDRNLRMNYARLLIEAGQLDKARREFSILLNQNPKDTESIYALGLLAAETRQFDLAQSYFLDLIKRNARLADAYYELGRIEEQRGAYAKAREWYGKVKNEERYLNAQMRLGVVLAKLENTDTVVQHFDSLRRGNPQSSINLYLAESEALREADHNQEAFDTLDRALALHPNDKDLLYARALMAERLSRLDVLERDLRAILVIDPKNGQALNALGYTLADRTDRHQEALGYIEQALTLLPEDAAVLDSMGWIQYRLGNPVKSLEFLRRAYRINPDAEIAAHLSEVLWVSGQREEARRIWRSGLSKQPDSRHLRELQKRFGW